MLTVLTKLFLILILKQYTILQEEKGQILTTALSIYIDTTVPRIRNVSKNNSLAKQIVLFSSITDDMNICRFKWLIGGLQITWQDNLYSKDGGWLPVLMLAAATEIVKFCTSVWFMMWKTPKLGPNSELGSKKFIFFIHFFLDCWLCKFLLQSGDPYMKYHCNLCNLIWALSW